MLIACSCFCLGFDHQNIKRVQNVASPNLFMVFAKMGKHETLSCLPCHSGFIVLSWDNFTKILKALKAKITLFQAGVPVDATDHKGLTPLMMACMFGRSLMAAYLLGRGARPNLTDMNGDSALHWAAYKGYPSLMQMLIYSGFDPQKPDNFGSSPLHLACISGNLMAVKLLCAKVSQNTDRSNFQGNHLTPKGFVLRVAKQLVAPFWNPLLGFLEA